MKLCEYDVVIRAHIAVATEEYDYEQARRKVRKMRPSDVLSLITRVDSVHVTNRRRFKS